jgi:biotin transport system substrate-specific component
MTLTIKQLTRIPIFTALIVVSTIVIPPIPIMGIPITLQTLMVMITGMCLIPVEAFMAMILYLLIGVMGFPVFSGFSSGVGILVGPTGGFLLAFPLSACLISYFQKDHHPLYLILVNLLFGVIFVYLIGIPFMSMNLNLTFIDGIKSMAAFLVFDSCKAVLAVLIKEKITINDRFYK